MPASVTTGPPDPLLTIVNNLKTGPKGSKREFTVYRGLGENTLEISGSIPVDDKGRTEGIGISHPALLFVTLLRNSLAQHGVTVSGQSRTAGARSSTDLSSCLARSATGSAGTAATGIDACGFVIANMQSPPFSVVVANTLKPSQNLYTEIILRTLGKTATVPGSESTRTSEDAGLEVVKTFLKEAGVIPASLVFSDGSGLSRNDMVTANATLQLLTYMSRHKYAAVMRDALPIAGVDGTLRNRMKGTVAEGNVRAKTGSLASAASLSGYLTTATGEKLVFSIMVNNFPSDVEPREVCIDPITVLLASFSGKP
jgi:D-alanyl-D-alanine carboxypeptidase/D-alanyl-D-alanine-endopeptidase (penicillin-binding protein 4)